jgi:lipopolysaccharide/colanic/teichoic acid biosynthesis glycosyltransferase
VKRALDVALSALVLAAMSPLMAAVAALIKLDSTGPVFFRQERVGRGFKPFRIAKFRTMALGWGGPQITAGADPRVTRVGAWLRRWKIDELPQLFNVLAGEMSLVGPRPEVPRYVEIFRADYAHILQVRPGITDLASIKYRDESAALGVAADAEAEYVSRILPDKIRMARDYVARASLSLDLAILARTALCLLPGGPGAR